MHPYLFDLSLHGHHLRAPTYGVLLALAFSLAYFYSLRQAIRTDVDPRHIEAFFLSIVFSSVLGSRLFHVAFEEPAYYWAHPSKILAVWEGGYTLYGAMLAAMLTMYLVAKIRKVPFFVFVDIAAPATALGIAVGRVGCFFAGCCWGRACDLPWAVTFTDPESFTATRGVPLHPAQLYEAFGALLVFFYLNWRGKHRRYLGQLFFEGLTLYSILRFIVEYFRGDDYRGYVFHGVLSYSQFVSLMILPFSVVGMFLFSRKKEEKLMAMSALLCPALIVFTFFTLSLLEKTRPLRHEKHRKSPRVARNLALAFLGLVSTRLFVLPWVLLASRWGLEHHFSVLSRVPEDWFWVRIGVAFFVFDYTMYLWHRLNHEVPFLWRFHVVHHADLELDVSTAARFHFGELFLSGGFRCAQVVLIGLDPMMLLWAETLITVAAEFHHSNYRLPRRLETNLLTVIVTPRMHLTHHSIVRAETNSNFGTVLTWWDRLHRTCWLGIPENEVRVGIPALRESSQVTLTKLLLMPFRPTPRWDAT